jgi:hypothetical protein
MAEAYLTGCPARPTFCASNAAELRAAAPSSLFKPHAPAIIVGTLYRFDPASLAVDDGVNVIKPNDIPLLSPGRWVIVTAAGAQVPPSTFFTLDGGEYSTIDLTDIILAAPGAYVGSPVAVNSARTLLGCFLTRRAAGTPAVGSETRLDVLKNGASIFTLVADQPIVTAAAGNYATDFKPPTAAGAALWVLNDRLEVVQRTTELYLANVNFPDGPSGWSLEMRWAP